MCLKGKDELWVRKTNASSDGRTTNRHVCSFKCVFLNVVCVWVCVCVHFVTPVTSLRRQYHGGQTLWALVALFPVREFMFSLVCQQNVKNLWAMWTGSSTHLAKGPVIKHLDPGISAFRWLSAFNHNYGMNGDDGLMTNLIKRTFTYSQLGGWHVHTSAKADAPSRLVRDAISRICPKMQRVLPWVTPHPSTKFHGNRFSSFCIIRKQTWMKTQPPLVRNCEDMTQNVSQCWRILQNLIPWLRLIFDRMFKSVRDFLSNHATNWTEPSTWPPWWSLKWDLI